MANALGLEWKYNDISEVYEEMAKVMPSLNNITWERLEKESGVTYPCDECEYMAKRRENLKQHRRSKHQ